MRGEIRELVERAPHRRLVGVALDVGVELRRGEGAAEHVALELGHVDAVGREAAHRLVERRRDVADAEDEGGQRLPGRRPLGLRRHDEEAGGVGVVVLDMPGEDGQPVDLRRELRRQRRERRVARLRHRLGRSGGVGAGDGLDAVLAQEGPALAEQRRLAHRPLHVPDPRPRHAEEVGVDADEMLAGDVEAGVGQQVVDVGDAPVGRVLDRQHRPVGPALAHRGDRALEGAAGERLEKRKGLDASLVRIGAGGTLERDPAGQSTHGVLSLSIDGS